MKKILFPILALVLALGLALPMATPAAAGSGNLLQNPGAETGMAGWDDYSTGVAAKTTQPESTGTVLPYAGSQFFSLHDSGSPAWMSQSVDLTGLGGTPISFSAGGYIQTEWYPEGTSQAIEDNDYGELVVEFYDSTLSLVGSSTSGPIGHPVYGRNSSYAPFSLSGSVPSTAVSATYKLWGYLVDGTRVNVFYDDLYFEVSGIGVPLCAGQNMDVGTVSVWNNDDNLYVKYETTGDWVMTETHLEVVTTDDWFPVTKTGNPKVGHFTWSEEHDPWVTEYTYTIDLGDWGPCTDLYIAAHAVVYKLVGEGCESPQWASSVVGYNQGTLRNGNPVTDPARIDPDKALGTPDASTSPPAIGFYSLGYVTNGDGWLELSFDYPVFNAAGDDIVVYEVTWGRPSYPVEKAEVWVQADGDWYLAGEVTNKDNGTGIGSVSIPDGILLVNAVKLVDSTDDPNLSGSADGYDVDAVGACYLVEQEETAWGDGCEGERFTERGNWATYFTYHVQ